MALLHVANIHWYVDIDYVSLFLLKDSRMVVLSFVPHEENHGRCLGWHSIVRYDSISMNLYPRGRTFKLS